MFDSMQDLLEHSLALNYKSMPIIVALAEALEKKEPPRFTVTENDLVLLKKELQNFFTMLELSTHEDGYIKLEDRVLH